MESLTLCALFKKKRKRTSSTKDKLMNLVRAVEEESTEAALAHRADAMLDPVCARDLVVVQSLVPRVLAVVGPLLLMEDDDHDPPSLFLTKAKQVVVNFAQAAGLKAVIFTLDPYLYDDAEHVRLTAIRVLDEIVRTVLVHTGHQQAVPQNLKYLISDVLKTGLNDESVRVRRAAAISIASLVKVCAGPPRVEIFGTWEISKADFLKSLCSTIGLLIDEDDNDSASDYFAREVLLDVHQMMQKLDTGEIKTLDKETKRAVLEILVQCVRLRGEEAVAAMCLVVSEFSLQFRGSEVLDSSEHDRLFDVMINLEKSVGKDAVFEIIDQGLIEGVHCVKVILHVGRA